MYIKKYWGNYIGGTDDSLNLVAFLADQQKDEISLSEIFGKIGLDKQNWNFRQTAGYLEFTHSNGVEMDFHFAIDVVTDLAAIMLECYVNGYVNLHDLLGEVGGKLCIMRELHSTGRTSRCDGTENRDIAELLCKGHFCLDDPRVALRVHVGDLSTALVKVTDDISHVLLGGNDLQ